MGRATESVSEPLLGRRRHLTDHVLAAACVFAVFAGVIKDTVVLKWAPIDPTVATCVFLGAALVASTMAAGARLRVKLWAVGLVATLVPPLFPAVAPPYLGAKVQAMFLTLLIVVASVYLVGTPARRRLWLVYLGAAGVLTACLLAILPSDPTYWGRSVFEGSNSIATGRMAGVAVVLLSTIAQFPGHPGLRLLTAGGAVASAIAMLDTGSRGPLLGVIAALVVVALRIGSEGRFARIAWLTVVFGGGWIFLSKSSSAGSARIEESLVGETSSTGTRDPLWGAAIRYLTHVPEAIGGTGWGGFGSVLRPGEMPDAGVRQYPHDVFLEVFIEGGWLTGCAITAFLVATIVRTYRIGRDRSSVALQAIVVFTLVNACVSGDVNDNRILWVAASLIWTVVGPSRDGTPRHRSERRALPRDLAGVAIAGRPA